MTIRGEIRDRIRRQFIEGISQSELAKIHGVNVTTISGWRRRDAAAGNDWDEQRDAYRMTPSGQRHTHDAILARALELVDATLSGFAGKESQPPEKILAALAAVSTSLEKIASSYKKIGTPQSRLGTALEVIGFLTDGASELGLSAEQGEKINELIRSVGERCAREYGNG